MNLNNAKKILEQALNSSLPLMLWGPPGVGKSSLVMQVASERNLTLIDLRLAQLDATDLRGIPVPNHHTGRVCWYPPNFLPSDGNGILFLDEIDKAAVLVKNSALQLVLDRRLGDYQLPHGWKIIAAGNRQEDNTFSLPLGAALANRMLHVEIDVDLDTWITWAQANKVHEDIIAFLRFRKELLYKQTEENAFPSPRSWTAASQLWSGAGGRIEDKSLISAAVGGATASEFKAWLEVYRRVSVMDILQGKLPDMKNDASVRYAVVTAVSKHISKNSIEDDDIRHLGSFLKTLSPELRVLFFKELPRNMVLKLVQHSAVKPFASQIVRDYIQL